MASRGRAVGNADPVANQFGQRLFQLQLRNSESVESRKVVPPLEETFRLTAQGLANVEWMGELAALRALPIYQLALHFHMNVEGHHATPSGVRGDLR